MILPHFIFIHQSDACFHKQSCIGTEPCPFVYRLWLLSHYSGRVESVTVTCVAHKALNIYSLTLCRQNLQTPGKEDGDNGGVGWGPEVEEETGELPTWGFGRHPWMCVQCEALHLNTLFPPECRLLRLPPTRHLNSLPQPNYLSALHPCIVRSPG